MATRSSKDSTESRSDLEEAITQISTILSAGQIDRHFYRNPEDGKRLRQIMLNVNSKVSDLRKFLPQPQDVDETDLRWAISKMKQLVSAQQVDGCIWQETDTATRLKKILFGVVNTN